MSSAPLKRLNPTQSPTPPPNWAENNKLTIFSVEAKVHIKSAHPNSLSFVNLVTPRFLKYTCTSEESFIFFFNVLWNGISVFEHNKFLITFQHMSIHTSFPMLLFLSWTVYAEGMRCSIHQLHSSRRSDWCPKKDPKIFPRTIKLKLYTWSA